TGNPNGTNLVSWPQYNASSDCYLDIKATPNGSQCGIRTAECNLWDNSIAYTPCISTIGINDGNKQLFTLNVYPNPTHAKAVLEMPNDIAGCELHVYNAIGQLVYKKPVYAGENQLEFQQLSKGVYTCMLLDRSIPIGRGKLVLN
ncbi:MAG TPA: T9SS type A sorting domain-containing protein, partial [Bacteroidia bacterium]|nr:T9SS type A sorting domain-containing protein [Bacteroidia bacterium]